MRINFSIFLLFIIIMISCNQNKIEQNHQTFMLGHRGSGGGIVSDSLIENTYESVVNGLKYMDGVEIDIQCTKDGIPVLFHDATLLNGEQQTVCVPNLTLDELLIIDSYSEKIEICTLNEILKFHHDQQQRKIISLDVKVYFVDGCFETRNADKSYQDILADKIIQLVLKYDMAQSVFVETDSKYFLDRIKSNSEIKTFLLGYDNFQKNIKMAHKKGYSGLSHQFSDPEVTSESLDLAHKKELKVMLWTPNSKSDLDKTYHLHPDFIQTDNISYVSDSTFTKFADS